MTTDHDDGVQQKRRRLERPEARPYLLKSLLENIRLAGDDVNEEVHINCVEYWNNNLYVGTSASEILHFVSLLSEPSDRGSELTFIEASRLQPAGHGNEETPSQSQGVQSITILPAASRACVLCNGTVSFYTLPELSPAPNGREVQGCQWVGGLDANQVEVDHDFQDLMVASAKRIRIVRVGDKIQGINVIQFPGCLKSVRRDTIACVADGTKYALLEIEHQQKIPLFPISSLEISDSVSIGQVEDLPSSEPSLPAGTSSLAQQHGLTAAASSGHGRSSSLGNLVSGLGRRQASPKADGLTRERLASPSPRLRSLSPAQVSNEVGNTSATSPAQSQSMQAVGSHAPMATNQQNDGQSNVVSLKPHVLSLTSSEFLLTTGTTENEPGVGIFVNLEGDVVRGTIEFERYPESIVVDRSLQRSNSPGTEEPLTVAIYVMMNRNWSDGPRKAIQIFSFNSESGELFKSDDWIDLPQNGVHVGFQGTASSISHRFPEVAGLLKLVRLHVPKAKRLKGGRDSQNASDDDFTAESEVQRNAEETSFAQSFGNTNSQVILWSGNNLFSLSANPLIVQLESQLEIAGDTAQEEVVTTVFQSLRNRDVQTETEFLSFNYIRQKASLLMFKNTVLDINMDEATSTTMKRTESMLIESNLDPRIVMLLLPLLNEEVLQGPQGVWLPAGLAVLIEHALSAGDTETERFPFEVWQMAKRYLVTWQSKRGFGSITDEQHVFDSVDAGLLRVLLHLEQSLPRGSSAAVSIRTKLYNVVDNWKGDFSRAVTLLEDYRRLFPLSRLYQSRRLARDVLATWRRVINGEIDGVGELNRESAELQMRRYLVNIRDTALVQEYALWLARGNADLAVEVFTDDKSRVSLPPAQVIQLLKKDAPGAVQNYLEYLVFNKGSTRYADDLIGYYLDSVLNVLETSEEARDSLAQSYSTYRALEAPKPTYLGFIHENAPPQPWWQSRLRLLQLLGGGTYASAVPSPTSEFTYSIPTVLARLAPFTKYLVSESIILDARQGRHRQALGLLTHGLGDYDTAVRYCYFAGPQPSTLIDESQLPSFETQKELFDALFTEFLSIKDRTTRLERSSELLAKFSKWFDPITALQRLPDEWNLDTVSEFLLRTMRALRGEMLEVSVVKALSAAENLKKQAEIVEACEKLAARVEVEKGLENAGNHDAAEFRPGNIEMQ